MSHEGIRFVSPEEAARSEGTMRELPAAAIQPASVRVDKTGGTGVAIDWKDGHQSHWSFAWLRDACPCATCVESRAATGRKPGEPKPQPKAALPMFKPAMRPTAVEPVGRYALRFDWNDGHTSGIYSWHYLRSMCDCEACRPLREAAL